MEEFENIQFDAEMSERVDRFLRKEMTKKESEAFIAEVKTNPELKECYQRQFNLMRGVKFQQMAELMKAKEKELSRVKPETAPKTKPWVYRYRYALSACAVAVAMVCGVFVWDGNVTKSVGEQMYRQIMRGGDSIDELVESGKYEEAIARIDEELDKTYDLGDDTQVIASYNESMNDLKYRKALVYLKMGKKRDAKTILKELRDQRSNDVLDKLLW